MRHFHHSCKFSTPIIDFSEVWPRQTVQPDDTSWNRLEGIFTRCLEDVLKKFLQYLLKTTWKRLEDVLIKTSWRRLQGRRMTKANIFVLIKMSWVRLEDVICRWRQKTSRRKTSSRSLEDVFIKANVCWEEWPLIWVRVFQVPKSKL